MYKELAKFFAGLTAWEAIVHLSLGLSGVLPLNLFGFTLTSEINTFQIVIPGIISVLLGYYAWVKK